MPKPLIPEEVPNKVPPAVPVQIITRAQMFIKVEPLWDRIKSYLAHRALDQIVKNADKIIKLVNKYEDYLLVYISNKNIRILIDGATDILEKLIVEWTKDKK